MKDKAVDRRVQRTRQLLNDALILLIAEKGYESITVQNIIDRANLGRSTFYAHYRDKEDLLRGSMDELVHSIVWYVEKAPKDKKQNQSLRILSTEPLFHHIHEQYQLYKAMVGGRGIDVIIKSIRTHLSSHIQEQIEVLLLEGQPSSIPPNIISSYLAGTLLTMLTWWLDNKMPHSPERMDEMYQELTMPGVLAALRNS